MRSGKTLLFFYHVSVGKNYFKEDKNMSKKNEKRDFRNVLLNGFRDYLISVGRAESTWNSYCVASRDFMKYFSVIGVTDLKDLTQSDIRGYFEYLRNLREKFTNVYKIATINNKIIGVNRMLDYCDLGYAKVTAIKCKRNGFVNDEVVLTTKEALEMLKGAKSKKKKRLYFALLIFFQTGIRVSELKFFTVEAVKRGVISIYNKGSGRDLYIADDLRNDLLNYCAGMGITSGYIIRTCNKKCVDRSYIYREIKKLADKLGIDPRKAYPHSFRHAFANNFIERNGDDERTLIDLSHILGHSSLNITKMYLKTTVSKIRKMTSRETLKIAS